MIELLPIGTVVDVVEPAVPYVESDWWGDQTTDFGEPRRYRARVEGYDMHHTKYRLAVQLVGERWSGTAAWAFPSWCTPASDTEVGG